MKPLLSLCLCMLCFSLSLQAQQLSEVEIEQNSLSGITDFGIVVNIEKPADLEIENLNPALLRRQIIEHFEGSKATILSLETLQKSYEYPFLHVHVNIMKADNGTYPFAIEMRFYQPVKLVLKKDLPNMAATWHSGYVGIVSFDLKDTIAATVLESIEDFKYAFTMVNG